jgi:hypothetical protein
MRVEIEWTRRARRDVLEIGDFIARDKPMGWWFGPWIGVLGHGLVSGP